MTDIPIKMINGEMTCNLSSNEFIDMSQPMYITGTMPDGTLFKFPVNKEYILKNDPVNNKVGDMRLHITKK